MTSTSSASSIPSASSIASGSYKSKRRVWQKTVNDIPNQTIRTATTIGWLKANVSRLNVTGTLPAKEKQQVYSFRALTTGNVTIMAAGDTGLHVQIVTQAGRVIADSSGTGLTSTNYTAMQQGHFNMTAGQYYVVISRNVTVPASKKLSYVVQAKMGNTFTDDYITQERPAKQRVAQPVTNPVAAVLTNSLTGYSGLLSSDTFGALLSNL